MDSSSEQFRIVSFLRGRVSRIARSGRKRSALSVAAKNGGGLCQVTASLAAGALVAGLCWLFPPLSLALEPSFFPQAPCEIDCIPVQQEQPGVIDRIRSLCLESNALKHVVVIHYPAGLSEYIDFRLAKRAEEKLAEGYTAVKEEAAPLTREEDAGEAGAFRTGRLQPETRAQQQPAIRLHATETYEKSGSSTRFVSLRFQEHSYLGGAHQNWTYQSHSFDLLADLELSLKDMFPEPHKSLPLLTARIAQGLGGQKPYLTGPFSLTEKEADIKAERLFLTPQGMQIAYAPYEQGGFAEGEFFIDIPRAELIAMGAAPHLWDAEYTLRDEPGSRDGGLSLYPVRDDAALAGTFTTRGIISAVPGVTVTVQYPRNLGHPAFDAMVERIALSEWRESARSLYSLDELPVPQDTKRYAATGYAVTASSPRYRTVLFETYENNLAARTTWRFTAVSFDMREGRPVRLHDIFPPGEQYYKTVLPAIREQILRQFREQRYILPDEGCTLEEDASLSSGKIAFTREGLDIFYSSGEERGCGSPPVRVSLPREELLPLGVAPGFWEEESHEAAPSAKAAP